MLKNPGRRLLSLTGRAPRNICVQCQIRLQHSVPAETASELDNAVESAERGPHRSERRFTRHPARQPRTYISRPESRPVQEFNFMKAVRPRPQVPDRRPISNQQEDEPSDSPAEMERDIDRVTEVPLAYYGILIF
jgi:hypothetical protein